MLRKEKKSKAESPRIEGGHEETLQAGWSRTKSQSGKKGLEDKPDNNGTLSKESGPSVAAEGTR